MRFQQGWENQQERADHDLVGPRQTFAGGRSEIVIAKLSCQQSSKDQKQKQPNPFQLFFIYKHVKFVRY